MKSKFTLIGGKNVNIEKILKVIIFIKLLGQWLLTFFATWTPKLKKIKVYDWWTPEYQ